MLRDNLVGLIEPMFDSAGAFLTCSRAVCRNRDDHRTIDPLCLENPRPFGAESTLTGNPPSPFHAEPGQMSDSKTVKTKARRREGKE
jgi:hypothetical protein